MTTAVPDSLVLVEPCCPKVDFVPFFLAQWFVEFQKPRTSFNALLALVTFLERSRSRLFQTFSNNDQRFARYVLPSIFQPSVSLYFTSNALRPGIHPANSPEHRVYKAMCVIAPNSSIRLRFDFRHVVRQWFAQMI